MAENATRPPRGGAALELEALALRVDRLDVTLRDPERFHEEKSEIAHELRELASRV